MKLETWRNGNGFIFPTLSSSASYSYQPELCAAATGLLPMRALKGNSDYVVHVPNGLAGSDGSEIIEAELKAIWQLVGFDHQFNAKSAVRVIVHDAQLWSLTRRKGNFGGSISARRSACSALVHGGALVTSCHDKAHLAECAWQFANRPRVIWPFV